MYSHLSIFVAIYVLCLRKCVCRPLPNLNYSALADDNNIHVREEEKNE